MNWILYAGLAAIAVSATTIAEKQLFKKERILDFLVSFGVFNTLLLWALFGFPMHFSFSVSVWAWALLAGLCCALMWYTGEKVIKHLDITLSSPLLALSALGTVSLAALFLGERFGMLQALGILCLLLGVIGLEFVRHGPKKSVRVKRVLWFWILSAIVFGGVGGVIDKYVLKTYAIAPNNYLLLVSASQLVFTFLLGLIIRRRVLNPLYALQHNPLLVTFIIVGTALQRYFYINAVALGPVSLVILIKRSSVLWTSLIGGRFFHEKKLSSRFVCAGAICIGLILLLY